MGIFNKSKPIINSDQLKDHSPIKKHVKEPEVEEAKIEEPKVEEANTYELKVKDSKVY